MQKEFDADSPELGLNIIGVNKFDQDFGNSHMTEGRDLPWLQDVDANNDRFSDAWELWGANWRNLIIVDAEGERVEVINLTSMDLDNADNYNSVKQSIMDAAVVETDPYPWQNSAEPLDVSNDGFVSPIDALQIINHLIANGSHELSPEKNLVPFLDTSGDNFVSPRDALLVINRLNAAEGEPAAAQPAVRSIDAAFAG